MKDFTFKVSVATISVATNGFIVTRCGVPSTGNPLGERDETLVFHDVEGVCGWITAIIGAPVTQDDFTRMLERRARDRKQQSDPYVDKEVR